MAGRLSMAAVRAAAVQKKIEEGKESIPLPPQVMPLLDFLDFLVGINLNTFSRCRIPNIRRPLLAFQD